MPPRISSTAEGWGRYCTVQRTVQRTYDRELRSRRRRNHLPGAEDLAEELAADLFRQPFDGQHHQSHTLPKLVRRGEESLESHLEPGEARSHIPFECKRK
jgi:hypothetical protein